MENEDEINSLVKIPLTQEEIRTLFDRIYRNNKKMLERLKEV